MTALIRWTRVTALFTRIHNRPTTDVADYVFGTVIGCDVSIAKTHWINQHQSYLSPPKATISRLHRDKDRTVFWKLGTPRFQGLDMTSLADGDSHKRSSTYCSQMSSMCQFFKLIYLHCSHFTINRYYGRGVL